MLQRTANTAAWSAHTAASAELHAATARHRRRTRRLRRAQVLDALHFPEGHVARMLACQRMHATELRSGGTGQHGHAGRAALRERTIEMRIALWPLDAHRAVLIEGATGEAMAGTEAGQRSGFVRHTRLLETEESVVLNSNLPKTLGKLVIEELEANHSLYIFVLQKKWKADETWNAGLCVTNEK